MTTFVTSSYRVKLSRTLQVHFIEHVKASQSSLIFAHVNFDLYAVSMRNIYI